MKTFKKIFAGGAMIWDGGLMFLWAYSLITSGFSAILSTLLYIGAFLLQVVGFARAMSKSKRKAGVVLILLGTIALLALMIWFRNWDVRMIVSLAISAVYLVLSLL